MQRLLKTITDEFILKNSIPEPILKKLTTEEQFLAYLGIKEYEIDGDKINVNGSVDMRLKFKSIVPIRFGVVTGDFSCNSNYLKNFANFPKEIGGSLAATGNLFQSLAGLSHISVGKSIILSHNKNIFQTVGLPKRIEGTLDLSFCSIGILNNFPTYIGEDLILNNNLLRTMNIDVDVIGTVDLSYNKIVNTDNKIRCSRLDYSENPISAVDDDVSEEAMW
jgi:hypothetical protein